MLANARYLFDESRGQFISSFHTPPPWGIEIFFLGHFNSRFASIGVSFFVIVSPLRGNSAAREFVFSVQDPQLRKDSERRYALRKLE